jgi:hypothetical protein
MGGSLVIGLLCELCFYFSLSTQLRFGVCIAACGSLSLICWSCVGVTGRHLRDVGWEHSIPLSKKTPNQCSGEEIWSWILIHVKIVYSRKKRPLTSFHEVQQCKKMLATDRGGATTHTRTINI